jgi:hypothetical protein
VFNSGGVFGAFPGFIFTSSGTLGVNRASIVDIPVSGEILQVEGDISLGAWGANKADLDFFRAGGSEGAEAVTASGTQLSQIRWNIWDGVDYGTSATIEAIQQGAVASNRVPTALVFTTEDTSADGAQERLRITPEGRLLLGDATPAGILSNRRAVFSTLSGSSEADIAQVHYGVAGSDTDKGDFELFRANGTKGAPTVPVVGNQLGTYRFGGWTGANFELSATMGAEVAMAPVGGNFPTDLVFSNDTVGAKICA